MPVYDLKNQADQLALAKELKQPKVLAWILERHYGKQSVDELRRAYASSLAGT